MINYFTPIPIFNSDQEFSIDLISSKPEPDPIIRIENSDRILIDMQYFKKGIPQAVCACYLRQDVYYRLIRASKKLPYGYKFKIFDAWRPLEVQFFLYKTYREIIEKKYCYLSPFELDSIMSSFVFPPSKDPKFPPPHTTGGAIDLSVIDEYGQDLDMGSEFDELDSSAHTSFFEDKNSTVANNRRLLYNIMISEGFTNLPSEWWHYDFGTVIWAFYSGLPSKYLGIFSEEDIFREIHNK